MKSFNTLKIIKDDILSVIILRPFIIKKKKKKTYNTKIKLEIPA